RVPGRAQAVHRLGRDLHRRVEAERVVGGREVVVDGLRYANDGDAGGTQLVGSRERSLTADHDQAGDARLRHRLAHALGAAEIDGVRAARAENGAAPFVDALDVSAFQWHPIILDDAAPAIAVSDEFRSVDDHAFEHG